VNNSLQKLASKLNDLSDPGCTLCPLHEDTDRVCIPVNAATERHPKGRLIVVAEAPGANEESTGMLLSGAAGQFLWSHLEDIGFERSNFFITNSVKCRPEGNRTPTQREIRVCSGHYLSRESDLIRPKFGLALGNAGLKATMGRTGITKYNGQSYDWGSAKMVAALHPAAVLRNPRYLDSFLGALLVFKRLVYDEDGIPATRTVCVNDKETLAELIEALKGAKVGAIDTETWSEHQLGGLYHWDPSFRMSALPISVKPGLAYVVPLWMKGARWKDPQKVVDILKPYIEAVPKWFMHNGKFDEKTLYVHGTRVSQWMDTMGAIYALDENNRKDLGFASQVWLGAPPYKDLIDKKHTNLADLDQMVKYAGQDADYTLRIGRIMVNELKKDKLSAKIFWKLLMPATRVLTDVEIVGMPIHRGKFKKRRAHTDRMIEEKVDFIQEFVPKSLHPFNPNSPQQMGNLLFKHLDFPVLMTTRSGAPSTAEGVLIRLNDLDESGVIDAILDYRHWQGYRSRYFDNWALRMDGNGRIHTTFKPFHTVTGRLSSAEPNIQQIPRDTFIRGLIGGRRGWSIVEVDYSQVELRIVAHISQDRTMLRAYHLGRDIHTETAMATTGLSEPEITSEIRKKAKAVNFGFVYGMGYQKFITYSKENYGIDVSEAEAKSYRDAFFDNFRGLYAWHNRQREAAKRRGWVISPIGRKRHLHDIESQHKDIRAEAERQAINSPVQSMASDMMLMSMVKLHDKLDPSVARIIGSVHDSILFEIRDEAVDDLLPQIIYTMENLPLEEEFGCRLTVPIKADAKVGKFWSEGAIEIKGS
jgi:uracil-DNA glycosylase family 4